MIWKSPICCSGDGAGRFWYNYTETQWKILEKLCRDFFQANQQEVGTLLPSAFKESWCLMTPCCNKKLFPFFRAEALQPDYFKIKQENSAVDALLSPQTLRAGSWSCSTVRGSPIHGGWQSCLPGLCKRGCVELFFLSGALFSGGDGLGWRRARGSPLLARKPDAWSHCLALPGKAGKASAGVIKQHAGAAGSEQAASEVPLDFSSCCESPWTANVAALKQKVLGGCLSSLVRPMHPLLGLHAMALRDGFGAKSSSRMKRLFPPPSSAPKPSTSSAMLRREQRLTVSRLQWQMAGHKPSR